MTDQITRSIRENKELCDGKKKEWNSLKKRFRNQVEAMTMQRVKGTAVITVAYSRDIEKALSSQTLLDEIVSSDEFKALGCESYTAGVEHNSYPTGWFYDLRIRIQF